MDFEKELKEYFKEMGYRYLGAEGGLIFYETSKGKRFGASEECFVVRIKEWNERKG